MNGVRPRNAPDALYVTDVVEMRATGLAMEDIGRRLSIAPHRVRRILERHAPALARAAPDRMRHEFAQGSRRLIEAIRRHHPERCAA